MSVSPGAAGVKESGWSRHQPVFLRLAHQGERGLCSSAVVQYLSPQVRAVKKGVLSLCPVERRFPQLEAGAKLSSPRAAHLFRNQLRERSHPFCSAASSEEEEREPYAATSSVPRRREEEPSSLVRRGVPEHTRPRQVTQQPGRGAEENPYAPSEEEWEQTG